MNSCSEINEIDEMLESLKNSLAKMTKARSEEAVREINKEIEKAIKSTNDRLKSLFQHSMIESK
jgi:hypothetical protein